MKLTIRQLEAFTAVAQNTSFSGAAKTLGISQPSVSAIIGKIEGEMGVRLFDRTTRSLRLTSDGKHLFAIADELVRNFHVAVEAMSNRSLGHRGRVVIGVLPSFAATGLPQALNNFSKRFPGVDVVIHDVVHDRALSMLRDGILDFAITTPPAERIDIEYEHLLHDRMMMVCSRDHSLAASPEIDWNQLQEHRFIGLSRTSSVRTLLDAGCLSAGVTLRVGYEVEQIPTVIALVKAGLGVTALPELTFSMFSSDDLAVRPIVRPALNRPIGVCRIAGRTQSVVPNMLVDELRILRSDIFGETSSGHAPYELPPTRKTVS
jgi:LysR family carnitine catabolism transcriptional activator